MSAPSTCRARRTIHILIEGRVQGVGFRAWVDLTARGLGLDGWVRNRRDGGVEAVLSGSPETIDAMVMRCRSGPPGARVDRLVLIDEGLACDAGFEVKPTA